MKSRAVLSKGGRYRYALTREWGDGPTLAFVMLNPSTADATVDDPTIRRCISFAQREDAGRLLVVNLYAYRATDPKELRAVPDPVGRQNDKYLARALNGQVIAAWGVNARPERVAAVLALVPDVQLLCLGTTNDGHPRHPLYVKGDTPLTPWIYGRRAL